MTTLLLTRPIEQSETFAQQCRDLGFTGDIVITPILDIRPRPEPFTLEGIGTLLFTSANAVRIVAQRPDLAGRAAVAVGDITAEAARDAGLPCISASGTVEDLLALLLADPPPQPMLHLRGAHGTGNLADRLSAAGLHAEERVIYDQVALPLSQAARDLLAGSDRVILPLFSPRSAGLVRARAGRIGPRVDVIVISDAAAAAWGGDGAVTVARHPDAAAMIEAVFAGTGN